MKQRVSYIVLIVILLFLFLSSCSWKREDTSSASLPEKTCSEGVCVEFNLLPPIVPNQPVNITVRVSATEDKPGLTIYLQASTTDATFGPEAPWQYDAVANQSQEFHSTVTFAREGYWSLGAAVFWRGGPLVLNYENVVITNAGAVINPTRSPTEEPYPRPPMPTQ